MLIIGNCLIDTKWSQNGRQNGGGAQGISQDADGDARNATSVWVRQRPKGWQKYDRSGSISLAAGVIAPEPGSRLRRRSWWEPRRHEYNYLEQFNFKLRQLNLEAPTCYGGAHLTMVLS
jgi:hypothetical protein